MAQAQIADDEEKKKYVVIYLEPQDAAVFKTAREYHDRTKTYDEWKLAMWKYSEQQNRSNVCSPHIHGAVSSRILIGITRFKFHKKAMHLTFP